MIVGMPTHTIHQTTRNHQGTTKPQNHRHTPGIPGTQLRWPEQGHVKIPSRWTTSKTCGSAIEINALAACAKWIPKQVTDLLEDIQLEILRTQEIVRGSQNIGLHHLDITMELARLSLAKDRYKMLFESIGATNLQPKTSETYTFDINGIQTNPQNDMKPQDGLESKPQTRRTADSTVQQERDPQTHDDSDPCDGFPAFLDGFPYDPCQVQ